MSDETPLLGLPLILPAQAQKHVTHNEGLALLDALVQPAVLTFALNTPPATPAEGDRHVTGLAPTGLWAGQAGKLAVFEGAVWRFLTPKEGWTVQIPSQQTMAIHEGGTWRLPATRPLTASQVGIGTTADATNVLSVAGPATLLSSAGTGGHQVKVNKAASGDTASLLFQTGFSGRAELGTIGGDDFRLKVSADGTSFADGIVVAGADASVSTPGGLRLPDGSAATPGLRFAADTDTGLHRSAANTVAVVAGGAVRASVSDTRMQIDVPASATRMGVGTTADAVNVLKSAGPATLLTHGGTGGHQARINKAAATDVASVQFQTGLSGRAEIGTIGSDTFSVKVSADGTTFADAIVIPVADASLSAPGGVLLPDGSAATPGLRFAADTDTGLHRPAANQLGFVTNGVVRASLSTAAMQIDLPTSATRIGVGTTADAVNVLKVAGPATQLSHAGSGGHQARINKAAATDTASVQFQTGTSGRAEIGTIGSDTFSVKVSADGTTFADAIVIPVADASLSAPGGVLLPDGSAATPGLRFAADTDTGLHRPAANQLGFVTNGVVRASLSTAAMQIDLPTSATRIGVGTTADAVNVLKVAGPATQLSHAGSGGHQARINKAAATDTASVQFQTGTSGRAEMGTIGSDTFSVKVSADGTTFADAIVIPVADASLSAPGGVLLPDGTAAAPGLRFAADTDTGLHRPAANQLGLVTAGVVRASVSDTAVQIDLPVTGTAVTQTATDTTAGRLLKVADFGLGGFAGDVSAGASNLPTRFLRFDADANTPDGARWHGMHIQRAGSDGQGAQIAVRETAASVMAVRNRGAGTPGAWSAWNVLFGRTNILATVSQTSGVPTGGLIETGSSANGIWRRFACGLQICWRLDLSAATVNTANGTLFRSASVTWTFPAAFIAAPVVTGQADPVDMWMTAALPITTSVALRISSATSVATATAFRAVATGRWF